MKITDDIKRRRKEIKEEARYLVGQVLFHPFFPHEIHVSMASVKEWLNQPHRHYAEKNEALLKLPELLLHADYVDVTTDPKGRAYIRTSHIFRVYIADEPSWIVVNENVWGECWLHSVSDNYKLKNKEQDL